MNTPDQDALEEIAEALDWPPIDVKLVTIDCGEDYEVWQNQVLEAFRLPVDYLVE